MTANKPGQQDQQASLPIPGILEDAGLTDAIAIYQVIFNLIPDAVFLISREERFLEMNQVAIDRYGYTREELMNMQPVDLAAPDERAPFAARIEKSIANRVQFESRHARKDGSEMLVEVISEPVEIGGLHCILETIRDITERAGAVQALKESEARYRTLFENMLNGFAYCRMLFDEKGRAQDFVYLAVNAEFEKVTGLKNVVGMRDAEVIPSIKESEPELFEIYSRVASTGQPETSEIDYKPLSQWLRVSVYSPASECFSAIFENITERKQMERELRLREEKYRSLFENSNVGMFRSEVDGSGMLDVNDIFAEMYGYTKEELIGKRSDVMWSDPKARAEVIRLLQAKGKIANYEAEFLTKSGAHRNVLISARLFPESGIIEGTNIDITELKQLELQLLQSQKMESIGRLAGGVAHDFNNYLTAVQGYIEMAARESEEGGRVRRDLEEAKSAAERAANLARQLLLFSRREKPHLKPIDLNQAVNAVLKMLGNLVGENYLIVTDLSAGLGIVKADPGHMEQVLMNLIVNARDAMPDGGEMIIKTENATVDEGPSAAKPDARPGKFVCLSVEDTGVGMDAETRHHIFEPFFSTKPEGKGTGLGLSVIFGIVSKHNGWIEVESSPGEGSRFSVYLPVVNERAEEKVHAPESIQEFQGHGEKILLVEDDDVLRILAQRMLTENGYDVVAAGGAEEAEAAFEKNRNEFRLIFTDVILPGKNGVDLAQKLESRQPGIIILLASGYTDGVKLETVKNEQYRFIAKPYILRDLLKTLRESLEAR